MEEWQPIETAPEGVEILVYQEQPDEYSVQVSIIHRASDGSISSNSIAERPTHWMPLPKPPVV